MSRFFAKSLAYAPSEEKLLFLWTVLEIYPMTNTTDIRPISELLGKILGRTSEIVKEKLGIGRLFGVRSDLVHNGRLAISRAPIVPIAVAAIQTSQCDPIPCCWPCAPMAP